MIATGTKHLQAYHRCSVDEAREDPQWEKTRYLLCMQILTRKAWKTCRYRVIGNAGYNLISKAHPIISYGTYWSRR